MDNSVKWKSILEINKLLASTLNIDEVLSTLVHSAKNLIVNADISIIYLYDQTSNSLKFASGRGVNEKYLKKIAFSLREAMTGEVFSSKKSILCNTHEEINEYLKSMSSENYYLYYKGMNERVIKSSFSVPLIANNICLGTIAISNYKENKSFTSEDLNYVEALANQASIAITNSQLFKQVEEKNEELNKINSIRSIFTKVMLENGGIAQILHVLSRLTNNNFTIVNDYQGNQDFAYPIKHGEEILTYLISQIPLSELTKMELLILNQASVTIELELMKKNIWFEKELEEKGRLFEKVLSNCNEKNIYTLFDNNVPNYTYCLIIDGLECSLWNTKNSFEKERFFRHLESKLSHITQKSTLLIYNGQIVIITSLNETNNVVDLTNELYFWFSSENIIIGVGRPVIPQSITYTFEEAKAAIVFNENKNLNGIVHFQNIGYERLLNRIDYNTKNYFVQDHLSLLNEADCVYLQTLEALIANDRKKQETADTLHIHVNTLYKRVQKIQQILNVDLESENDWINIVIACKLYRSMSD